MKNKRILVIIALVLLLGGGATWYFKNKDSDDTASNSSQSTSDNQASESTDSSFNPLSTSGVSAVSTITSTIDGVESVAVMEYDADTDAVRYTTTTDGEKMIMIITKDSVYMCQTADNCLKYPSGTDSTSGFDRNTYEYTQEEIEGWKSTAMDQGEKDCPAGKCNVWSVNSGGYESTVYIDKKTRRISMVESSSPSGSTRIVYEYKDVNIEIPLNAQNIEIPNIPQ